MDNIISEEPLILTNRKTVFCGFEFFGGILSCLNSILCIVGELAGGGSVAVAVGVGDR